MKKTLLLFCIPFIASPVFSQQQLEKLFQVFADSTHPWFNPDDMTRGMAVNPKGSVLVADRGATDAIYRLDPFTGEEKGTLNTTTLSGGAFSLNKIAATNSGQIYVSNLSTGANPFKIYYYYDELSEPFLIYEDPAPGARWGDDMAITGTGTRVQLLITGSDNPLIMVVNDLDGDGSYSSSIITPINPAIKGTNNVTFDLDIEHFWLRQSTAASASSFQFNLSNGIGSKSSYNSYQGVGPLDIALVDRHALMALGPGIVKDSNLNENKAYIIDMDESVQAKYTTELLVTGIGNQNINGSGDVVISPANRTLHILYSNNSISGWRIPRTE